VVRSEERFSIRWPLPKAWRLEHATKVPPSEQVQVPQGGVLWVFALEE
jgi:hypothetical protein